MKKIAFIVSIAIAILLSTGVVAYADNDFTMKYLPGTNDYVTNVPTDDSGIGGKPYIVSATVPLRQGYEFINWILDYGTFNTYTLTYQVKGDPRYGKPTDATEPTDVTDIREGSHETLSNGLTTAWTTADGVQTYKETYKVNYLEQGTDKVLAPQKVVTDQEIGSTVTEPAIAIDGYAVVGNSSQDLTIRQSRVGRWTFTGWCSDEECTMQIKEVTNITSNITVYGMWNFEWIDLENNEITFYYTKSPEQLVSYYVRYVDIDTFEALIPDIFVENIPINSYVRVEVIDIPNYISLYPETFFMEKITSDQQIIIVPYFWNPPLNVPVVAPIDESQLDDESAQGAATAVAPIETPEATKESNTKRPEAEQEPQIPETKAPEANLSELVDKKAQEGEKMRVKMRTNRKMIKGNRSDFNLRLF